MLPLSLLGAAASAARDERGSNGVAAAASAADWINFRRVIMMLMRCAKVDGCLREKLQNEKICKGGTRLIQAKAKKRYELK